MHGPCDAPVQERFDSFGFDHADLEGDGRARLVGTPNGIHKVGFALTPSA